MSKKVKEMMIKELADRYESVDSALVVNPLGIDGTTSNEMRGDLRSKSIRMEVIRNSLARKAFADTSLSVLAEVLDQSCALITGGDSIVDVAKHVKDWSKKVPEFQIRGAVVEGSVLDAQQALKLADMPNRQELQGQVVQIINSPGASLAGAIASPGGRIAGCIKTLVERLEEGTDGQGEAAA